MDIFISFFTFTWQPKRTPSANCLRVKCGVSVGRASPPPSCTWHSHCIQVPPPPQAEGKNIFSLLKVVSNVEPLSTSISLSPFMVITTFPEGKSLDFANSNSTTNKRTITKNTMMLIITVFIILIIRLEIRNL